MKKFIFIALSISMVGCANLGSDYGWQRHQWNSSMSLAQMPPEIQAEAANLYKQGFRKGVKKNIETVSRQQGNTAPYIGWQYPIYEDVTVPTEVRGGAVYLRHVEPMVMQPGAYRMYHGQPFEPAPKVQYKESVDTTVPANMNSHERYREAFKKPLVKERMEPKNSYRGRSAYLTEAAYEPHRDRNRYAWGE